MSETELFQNKILTMLGDHFDEVTDEWPVSLEATDDLSPDSDRYTPRIDVAVGPFNVGIENIKNKIESTFLRDTPEKLKNFIESNTSGKNQNPRCTLAIEIEFSGSEKVLLGDITNASMMGLYGFVIANDSTMESLRRVFRYTKVVKDLEKAPQDLFSNICIISDSEFVELLQE